ncbi:MAG TPA: ATP-binding protein, partial [Chthoniobacteraceae bacterium]|nr:ATP-binding protein [Chthoniobacteraceae bacterium]
SPEVHVARVEIQQVLVNLLVNAVQAMKATPLGKRTIEVATSVESLDSTVSIRDHGHGISSDRMAQIFAPFFSTKSGGLGIGLSISSRIVQSHSGQLEARNHEEGGTTFIFSLPVVK